MSFGDETILYPNSHNLNQLDAPALSAKIARHSRCDLCDCRGLIPPDDVTLLLEGDTEAFQVRLREPPAEHPDYYPALCKCGHTSLYHGNQDHVAQEERIRRAKVAIRIDELLEDKAKLLDFNYVDQDVLSLRKQMKLHPDSLETDSKGSSRKRASPDSLNDPDDAPLAKRRRTTSPPDSVSTVSSDDDDRPLAQQQKQLQQQRTNGHVNGHVRAGKKTGPGMGLGPANSSKAPAPPPADTQAVKLEDEDMRLDGDQLERIANGVTIDAANQAGGSSNNPQQEKAAILEQRAGILKIVPVTPDGSPEMNILLTGLKTLFQKQLPKMPREYITRLVFDENSRALAIVKRGLKVVGGITFRPFPHRNFAEIVFFATASVDQVRGYGGMLMNNFKMHIRRTYEGMNHFLTYADNYAVGYFRKQGFTKEISLDRSIWAGYIKDYEGGTLMQCEMVPKVDYLHVKDVLLAQREAILDKIRARSRAHVVYDGITNWKPAPVEPKTEDGDLPPGASTTGVVTLDPQAVPGLRESGWTFELAALQAKAPPPINRTAEEQKMRKLLQTLINHKSSWPFVQPVNPADVVDYYAVIKHPMDFSTMEHKLEIHRYPTLDAFAADVRLICDNCTTYNDHTTVFHKAALTLSKFLDTQLAILERED